MLTRVDDFEIERAAHDAAFRRQVIARLKRETVEAAAAADPAEEMSEAAVE